MSSLTASTQRIWLSSYRTQCAYTMSIIQLQLDALCSDFTTDMLSVVYDVEDIRQSDDTGASMNPTAAESFLSSLEPTDPLITALQSVEYKAKLHRLLQNKCRDRFSGEAISIADPHSRQTLLTVLVDTAEVGCRNGWLNEDRLTRRRTHTAARRQDVSTLGTRFQEALGGKAKAERVLSEAELRPFKKAFRALYGTCPEQGKSPSPSRGSWAKAHVTAMRSEHYPCAQDILSSMVRRAETLSARIRSDERGVNLERGSRMYGKSMCTTQGLEVWLWSVRQVVQDTSEGAVFVHARGVDDDGYRAVRDREVQEFIEHPSQQPWWWATRPQRLPSREAADKHLVEQWDHAERHNHAAEPGSSC